MQGLVRIACLPWLLVTLGPGLQDPALPDDRARVERCIAELTHMVLPAKPSGPRPEILLLGTFHFDDQGLDEYKPKHRYDTLSERGVREIEEVLERLEGYRPTRICVEYPAHRQAELDQSYARWLAGEHPSRPDEIHTLAFDLARRLSHARVFAVDAASAAGLPEVDVGDRAKELGQEGWLSENQPIFERYMAAIEKLDSYKETLTLREIYLVQNDPSILRLSHGAYLVGSFRVGRGEDYAGADAFPTQWYNRNLRIFSNILRLADSAEQRLLVLIGAGHVPILHHAAECSPEVELIEVEEVLGGN